jgi:hypothetical protein
VPDEAATVAALVVVARSASAGGFTGNDIRAATRSTGTALPVLWLVGAVDEPISHGELCPLQYPVSLDTIAAFIATLANDAAATSDARAA